MNLITNNFNLLPWREKSLKNKIKRHLFFHLILIALFCLIGFFANKYFDKIILYRTNNLLILQKKLITFKKENFKRIENNLKNKNFIKLEKIFENNKKNIEIIHSLIDNISSSIGPGVIILYFYFKEANFILRGKSKEEAGIFSLINQLSKNKYIKNLNLENIKKHPAENNIYFQMKATLKKPHVSDKLW